MSMNDPLLQLILVGGPVEQSRPGKERLFAALILRQSCSLRVFLRALLRASAAFTRFFSPGFR
jgi:hypothetical protein